MTPHVSRETLISLLFRSPAAGTKACPLTSELYRTLGDSSANSAVKANIRASDFPLNWTIATEIPHDLPTALRRGKSMASINRYRTGYRAQIFVKGRRRSKTFRTMREAQAWAVAEESRLSAPEGTRHTVRDLIERYIRDVMEKKGAGEIETRQAKALLRDFPALAGKKLSEVDTPDFVEWRDARLKVVSAATVLRYINWLRHAFRIAREEWKWMEANPLKGLTLPGRPVARDRRVLPREARLLCRSLDYRPGKAPKTKQQEVALAFMVGLRSAMRAGEMLSLGRDNLDLVRRVARVKHKTMRLTGRLREIPLTRHAVRLLAPVADRERCFTISSAVLDTLFRRARNRLLIKDLHFHDSRAEALTRLARKVDLLTLSRISGHKDLKLLGDVYYRETAEQIAARLS